MISKSESLKLLKQNFLEFFISKNWLNYYTNSNEHTPSYLGIVTTFSDYALDLFKRGEFYDLEEIFKFVEEMLQKGDEDVQIAFTTCFLENLLNLVPDIIPPSNFVPLLGQESRNYCKSWDDFNGVKTEGLY